MADLANAEMAVCLCERRMFDLADETLEPSQLTRENVARFRELNGMVYHVADALETEELYDEAHKYFKRIFRVDAAYRDVVNRLDRLSEY